MADYEDHGNTNYDDNWEDYQEYADQDYDYDQQWTTGDYPTENAQAERETDPWHEEDGEDPWTTSSASSQQPRGRDLDRRSERRDRRFVGAVSHDHDPRASGSGHFGGSKRIIHDIPPTWDGKDPKTQLEPYLKLLKGWLATTQTIKSQRGYLIMQYSTGTLRELIDDLDIDQLLHENSGKIVLDYILAEYQEFVDQYKLPTRIEECLYESDRYRKKGESMITYIARRRTRFEKLKKEGWDIPEKQKGYFPTFQKKPANSSRSGPMANTTGPQCQITFENWNDPCQDMCNMVDPSLV